MYCILSNRERHVVLCSGAISQSPVNNNSTSQYTRRSLGVDSVDCNNRRRCSAATAGSSRPPPPPTTRTIAGTIDRRLSARSVSWASLGPHRQHAEQTG